MTKQPHWREIADAEWDAKYPERSTANINVNPRGIGGQFPDLWEATAPAFDDDERVPVTMTAIMAILLIGAIVGAFLGFIGAKAIANAALAVAQAAV